MDKIKEIEKRVIEKGIESKWQFVKDWSGEYYTWKFQKSLAKCEFKLSEWDLNQNTENVIKLVLDYFENYKLMFTTR